MDETDTRYTRHNIDASDAFIQDQSGVTEILRSQPNFYEMVDPTFRNSKIFNLYTRETIPWALECDLNGVTRQEALDQVQNLEGTIRVNYEGMEISNIVHYVAAGFCAALAFVTLITPTGPCFCFAHKAPFTIIFGTFCFVFFAVLQFILGGTAFSYMRQLLEQDTLYRSELTDLQIFTGCSDSETSVPKSILENESVEN